MNDGIGALIDVKEENDLTRVVIGSLEFLGPEVINRIFSDAENFDDIPKVRFDQEIERGAERRLDAVIETESVVIGIEAKRGADYDKSQLEDEYRDLADYSKGTHHLYLITGHTAEPEGFQDLDVPTNQVSWIGWGDIAEILNRYLGDETDHTRKSVANLATQQLRKEGYESFRGFQPVLDDHNELMDELNEASAVLSGYFEQINTFRRKVDGMLANEGIRSVDLFRDGISTSLNNFSKKWAYVPRHVWIGYAESEADIKGKQDNYRVINFNSRQGKILVGYQARLRHDEELASQVELNSESILDWIDNHDASLFQISYWGYLSETITGHEAIQNWIQDRNWEDGKNWVLIGYEHDIAEFDSSESIKKVVDELKGVHHFAEKYIEA